MIRGVHTMFYSSQAEATRAFLRDKLGFPFSDVGEGWLIFEMPRPTWACIRRTKATNTAGPAHTRSRSFAMKSPGQVADLKAKGVEFLGPVTDEGYGLVTYFKMPGGVSVQLYQPHYTKNPTRSRGF